MMGGVRLRFACEYGTKSGMTGLLLFQADNLHNAQMYVKELIEYHGHRHVFNLQELKEGTIGELYRLYPRRSCVTTRGQID